LIHRNYDELKAFAKTADVTNKDFSKTYGTEMAKAKLSDLIPGLSASDISFDTDAPVIDVDPSSNSKAGEARTFTL
jgi:hypothetical protein